MTRHLHIFLVLLLAIAGTLIITCAEAQEMPELDIGPKFRAKIAKEKAKSAANQSTSGSQGSSGPGSDGGSQCGSQNIGSIDTGGRPGTAPREVFVFAPNAVNMVSNGCK